jgi:hypothetical protein
MENHRNLLLDLPPEVLDLTLNCLAQEDLFHIRLVSKHASIGVMQTYLALGFSTIHVIPALEASLERMTQLSNHPHLLRLTRTVKVYSGAPGRIGVLDLQSYNPRLVFDHKTRHGRAKARATLVCYEQAVQTAQRIARTGRDAHCLSALLKSIANASRYGDEPDHRRRADVDTIAPVVEALG